MNHNYVRKPNCKCKECGKEIYRRPFQLAKGVVFCSHPCYAISNRKSHPCPVCSTPVYGRKNALTCSRKCSNIYRTGISYKIGRPRDNAYPKSQLRSALLELRGAKCNRCPFDFAGVLQIHHIIERCNGGTDDYDNLEILCPNCHMIHHYINK